jgi:hypothetical protein
MVKLVVNDQQAEFITTARDQVVVCDRQGRFLGYLSMVDTSERIAEMRRRAALHEPTVSTNEVLAHLDALKAK